MPTERVYFLKSIFLLHGGRICFPQFWNLPPVASTTAVLSQHDLKEKRNMTGDQIVKILPHRHIADFYARKNALQVDLKHFSHAFFCLYFLNMIFFFPYLKTPTANNFSIWFLSHLTIRHAISAEEFTGFYPCYLAKKQYPGTEKIYIFLHHGKMLRQLILLDFPLWLYFRRQSIKFH